jgi:hypothetical protein
VAAPQLVIYDNACNLHRYCVAREPGFFCRTKFFSDRFHFKNHIDCARAFCIDVAGKLIVVDTSIVESENAAVARVKAHCQHMSKATFMWFFKFFFLYRNLRRANVEVPGLLRENSQKRK